LVDFSIIEELEAFVSQQVRDLEFDFNCAAPSDQFGEQFAHLRRAPIFFRSPECPAYVPPVAAVVKDQ